MAYPSNYNAVLFNDCNTLQNLEVLVEVGSDIATFNNGGWSLQLNCYPPEGQYCQKSEVNLLQYIVIVQGGVLQYYIQYWSIDASPWPSGYTPLPGTSPGLPCWDHDYGEASTFATGLSGDTLPSGSLLQIAFATDSNGGVDTATFNYVDPEGVTQKGVFVAPVALPINGFQLNFVGPPGGNAIFTPSLPVDLIRYSVSSGVLSVASYDAYPACLGLYITDETSNMVYSDINGAPGSTVTQTLQQPTPGLVPTFLTFPSQQVGTTSLQKTVTVVAGDITLTGISLVNYPPSDGDQFVCVPPPGEGPLDLQNGVLVITVWFRPTAAETHGSQLVIGYGSAGSTIYVQLSGVGDAAPAPLLTVSPQSLLFTTTKITNHTVTLTNPGRAPLTINTIAIDGPSSFTFGTTCNVGPGGGILNPGEQCTITVAYHGVVDSTANLVITHNAVGSPTTIDIEADVGKGPQQ
jgi:hypothetical protein